MKLRIVQLEHAKTLPLPSYARDGDAGFDLRLAIPEGEALLLQPGDRAAVPTGLCFDVPGGYELQVRPRSGLALRAGLDVLNSPGTVDSGYTGEVKVILRNAGHDAIELTRGDRIAQAVVAPVIRAEFVVVDALEETDRGAGGFGHTGVA